MAESANAGSIYAGFLMVPSVRSEHAGGRCGCWGFRFWRAFLSGDASVPKSVRNAREYIPRTPFEDRTGTKIVTVLSIFGDVWSDDDGSVVRNLQLRQADLDELLPAALAAGGTRQGVSSHGDPESDRELPDAADDEDDLDDDEDDSELDDVQCAPQYAKMTEKRVAVGEPVCAIGTYDEMRRGLIPPGRSRSPNRLICGSAAASGAESARNGSAAPYRRAAGTGDPPWSRLRRDSSRIAIQRRPTTEVDESTDSRAVSSTWARCV